MVSVSIFVGRIRFFDFTGARSSFLVHVYLLDATVSMDEQV